ncbi:MAG: DUF507 family protein [Deltaproteobacteria bacterium]|nr:DUF507 family protein [Deltaproteobacteria bacterium]
MRLSEERISHLSHLILDQLLNKGFLFVSELEEPALRRKIKTVFLGELSKEDELDDRVRKKIASYRRDIPEGSSEWDILYQRFYNEEKGKSGSR